MSETQGMERKAWFLAKLLLFAICYYIVDEFLTALNNEQYIQNWGVGLIGMMIFIAFYTIQLDVFIFKMNKVNVSLISFFFSWILSDWQDFLAATFNAFAAVLALFGLM